MREERLRFGLILGPVTGVHSISQELTNFASNVQYLTEHVTGNSLQARVVNISVTPESFCSPLSRKEKQWFRKKSRNEIQSKTSVLLCVYIGTFFAAVLAKTTKKNYIKYVEILFLMPKNLPLKLWDSCLMRCYT